MESVAEAEEFDNLVIDPDLILSAHTSARSVDSSPRVRLVAIEVPRPEPIAKHAESQAFPRWLSPLEVAEVLRLDRHTVYRLLRDGALPGTKIGGRWFVGVEALAAKISGSG